MEQTPMTRPWRQVVEHFERYVDLNPAMPGMLELARFIAAGPLAEGLFAWTSMLDLCIVQAEVYHPYDGPELRVAPILDGRIEFRYVDTHIRQRQWCRTVAARDAPHRLLSFLDQLRWFPAASLRELARDRQVHRHE